MKTNENLETIGAVRSEQTRDYPK